MYMYTVIEAKQSVLIFGNLAVKAELVALLLVGYFLQDVQNVPIDNGNI